MFVKMYNQINTKFDIEFNKAQYHTNSILITYFLWEAKKENVDKTNLDVLQASLEKLQLD